MDQHLLHILAKAGYTLVYNEDEGTEVFQKANSDQYMTGEVYENKVNMSLHDSFFNRVVFEDDDEKFIKDFEETFDRLVKEYGFFEGGEYYDM